MITAQVLWHSFTHWIIGWGGVSLLVAALAGALWYFTPPILSSPEARAVLFNVALGALAFSFISNYFYTSGYSSAINGVVNNTKEVRDDMLKAVANVDQCNNVHGTWDTVTGLCEQQRE